MVISSTRFTKALDQQATPSTGLGGKLELRPSLGPDTVLRLGADFRRASGHTEEEAFNAATGARTAVRRAGGRTQVELSYLTTAARWTPAYEARADASAHSMELSVLADVQQQTGET